MPFYDYGTFVDFQGSSTIPNKEYVISGIAGFYGYQQVPSATNVNLDAIAANFSAFMSSLASALITVKYAQISWNISNGVVSDFVFGVAYEARNPVSLKDILSKLPTDFQILLAQLEMVFGPSDNPTINGFTSYLLYGAVQSNAVYTASTDFEGSPYTASQVGGTVPTDAELAAMFISEGRVDEALSSFQTKMAAEGYNVTMRAFTVTGHAQPVGIDPYGRIPYYKSMFTLTYTFISDKPLDVGVTAGVLIAPIIIAICLWVAIWLIANMVNTAVENLTSTKTTVKEELTFTNPTGAPVTITLPNGQVVTVPPGGTVSWSTTKDITQPPEWYSWVIPIVILGALGITAAFLLPLRPRRKEA